MKNLAIICLFLSKLLVAQTVLVPYRVGTKFGLSNEKGRLVVKPEYDGIEYLNNKYIINGNYFKYTNVSVKTDTIIRYSSKKKEAQERKVYSYGLFNQDKLIIKEQTCSDFLIYPYLIIASTNPYHAERCVLYNLKGKRLTTEPIGSMYVNDKRDLGYLSVASKKHTLLSIFYRDEKHNRTFSLAVYDNEKQAITQWLLNKVTSFKVEEDQKKKTFTGFTYRDEDGIHEKYLRFKNNTFEIVNQSELTPPEKEALSVTNTEYSGIGDGLKSFTEVQMRDFSDQNVAVPNVEKGYSEMDEVPLDKYPKTEQAKRKFTYYIKKRSDDSLFFVEPNAERFWYSSQNKIATYVKVPEGVSVIYINSQSPQQYEQLIYKESNKYGILNRGVFTGAIYDSLLYFGSDFIAGIKKDNNLQFGIVKPDGKEVLPVLYDSIKGNMQQAEFRDVDYKTNQSQFILRDKQDGSDYSKIYSPYWKRRETANALYKNEKTGILDYSTNEIILPVEYDLIAENGTNYTGFRNSKYIILKKNGKYGITHLDYNSLIKKLELKNTTTPVFNYIPCFYIDDYCHVKDFRLFGLFDQNGKGVGYANESGFEYFRNNN